ncbi:methyltransferase-like protein 17, mitochondrial [Plodia interpunctella]|uniref:methyltransferase-like protein 17, mitochondrial n=1 Tax=Plodia interpunctella TaxID=58824 RepID=UPI00236793CD|nr:methyltransferase-like protein 17, mitochondrial [Plodia interpunctella]
MLRKIKLIRLVSFSRSSYSTRLQIDAHLAQDFESKQYKPRKHPGSARIKIANIPPDIQKAIYLILEDSGARTLYQESEKLSNYIRSRLLPPEDDDIRIKAAKIHTSVSQQVLSKINNKITTPEEEDMYNKRINTSVFNILKKNVYRWGNISYDKSTCLQYLMARAAPEYAILVRVLDEIKKKDENFKPRSFFDFGSGVASGTWAVNTFWKGDIYEYFCVDTSQNMHDLARLILCSGKDNVEMSYKGYFQRQFLPASTNLKYDIVLSAFSLFEMPDMKTRLETIQKLWNKTENYLVIVEHGSNAGFRVVNEAREFVLNLPKEKKSSKQVNNTQNGYAFSPCPNDNVCPRYLEQETPYFLMKYETLQFPSKSEISADVFSYVILRKGVRPSNDPQWPRVVRALIVRSGHTICKLCMAKGELKEVIFSKSKHDQITYRCARSSNWGDELPLK